MLRSVWGRRYAVNLAWWAASGWPLVAAHLWPLVTQMAIWGVIGTPVMMVVQERRRTRATGWDPQRRTELIRAARRGQLPAAPAERATLRSTVAAEMRDGRGLLWFAVLWPAALAGLLVLPGHRPSSPVLTAAISWYVALAAVQVWFARQLYVRRQRVLSTMDSTSV